MEESEEIQLDLVSLRENVESQGSFDKADGMFVLTPNYQDHQKFQCTMLKNDEKTGGTRMVYLGKWEVSRTHQQPIQHAYYDNFDVVFNIGVMISMMTTWISQEQQVDMVVHFQREIKKQFCTSGSMGALMMVIVPLVKKWATDSFDGRDMQCLEQYLCLIRNLLKIRDDVKAMNSSRHIHDDFLVAMHNSKLTDLLVSFTHQTVVRKDTKLQLILLESWHYYFILEKPASLLSSRSVAAPVSVDNTVEPQKKGTNNNNASSSVLSLLTNSQARNGPTKSRLGGGQIQQASILPGGPSRVQFGEDDAQKRHNDSQIGKAGKAFIFEQEERVFSQVRVQQAVVYTLDKFLAPQPQPDMLKPPAPVKKTITPPNMTTPSNIAAMEARTDQSHDELDELREEKESWKQHTESMQLRYKAQCDEAERVYKRELFVYEEWDNNAEVRKTERVWLEAQNSLGNLFLHQVRQSILQELADGDENSMQDATYWCSLTSLIASYYQRRWERQFNDAQSKKEPSPPLALGSVLECVSVEALEFVLNSITKSMEKPLAPSLHIVSIKLMATQLGVCSGAYKHANETEFKVIQAYQNIVCSEKETLHTQLKSVRAYEPTKLPRSCLIDLFVCVDQQLSLYELKHDNEGKIQVIGKSRKKKSGTMNIVEQNTQIEPFVHPVVVEHLMLALRTLTESREYKSVIRVLKRVLNNHQAYGLFFHIPLLMQMDEFFDDIKKHPRTLKGKVAEVNEVFKDISAKFIAAAKKNPMLYIESQFSTTFEKVSFLVDPKQHIANTLGGHYVSSSSFSGAEIDGVSEQTIYKLDQQRVRNVANIVHSMNLKNKRNMNEYSESMIHKLTSASHRSNTGKQSDEEGEDLEWTNFNEKNNKILTSKPEPVLREQSARAAKKKKSYKHIVDHTDDELSSSSEEYTSEYDENAKEGKSKKAKPTVQKTKIKPVQNVPSNDIEEQVEPDNQDTKPVQEEEITQVPKKRRIVLDSDEE